MWLIETRTLRLKFVTDARQEDRPYAILSHTWVDGEEVTFQEFQDPERARAARPAGYAKIAKTCELALREEPPLEYCWVDTCCIDKTSSAELTEAINSMFRWYKHSAVCYAFLSDLEHSRNTRQEDLAPCRWFTRGWTLQELIAPRVMAFFDKEWRFRGTKRKLRTVLSEITGIPTSVLGDCDEVFGECIARRMSWAASRQTTRVEDKAYCLLGIFGVYMPMIYGEGSQAFMRLQEELIKGNHDRSLFAWKAATATTTMPEGGKDKHEYRGLLAHDANEFAHCGRYGRLQAAYRSNSDFVLTNRGVRFEGFLPLSLHGRAGYLLDLECCDYIDFDVEADSGNEDENGGGGGEKKKKKKKKRKTSWVGILLEKTGKNGFVRSEPRDLRFFDRFLDDQWYPSYLATPRYFVARDLHAREARDIPRQYALSVQVRLPRQHVEIVSVAPEELWDPAQRLFWTLGADTFIGCLVLRVSGPDFSRQCLLVCGTRRANRANVVLPAADEQGGREDGSDAGGQAKTGTGPAGINRRIPWCYTLDGKAMAQVRLYTGNDHGSGGEDGSARRTEYYNDDLIRSHNFLSQLWRAIPDPKPAAHETSWDRAEAGPRSLRHGLEVTTSVARFREQDAFRIDVSTWGEDLGGGRGGKGGAEMAIVVHTPVDGDGGGGGGSSDGSGSGPRMLPVRFRHVASRSLSRSPPGDKQKTRQS